MTFNSLQYAIFLPVVLALYWRLHHRGQNALLLVASYLFYGAWDWRFLGLMLLTTGIDFSVGRALGTTDDEARRKRLFATSVIVNLSVLGFFKYVDFFSTSTKELLERFGLQADFPTLRILLPVGISFYTFHGISYAFDVYRRRIEPTRDLMTFAVFVAYFPQLVAGPIGRAEVQLPQFEHPRTRPKKEQVAEGLFLILLGLFKKVAIADMLSWVVDPAFEAPGDAGVLSLLVAMVGFVAQVYCDFSGYSDIARGSSRLFGIELLRNFEQPYLSRDINEYWRRNHMSLSTWLRDYLYVPLGGNRGTPLRTNLNIMATMVLGGLWHGASWTFVAWGAEQGALVVGQRVLARGRELPDPDRPLRLRDAPRVLVMFTVLALGLVLFRSTSIGGAWDFYAGIATFRHGLTGLGGVVAAAPFIGAILLIDLAQRRAQADEFALGWDDRIQGLLYGGMILGILAFSGGPSLPFIYFQF